MSVKVRERPKGSGVFWVIIHHKGTCKTKKIGNKSVALEVAKKIEAKLVLGEFDLLKKEEKVAGPAFNEIAVLWLDDYVKPMLRDSTYERYKSMLEKFVLPAFSTTDIKDIKKKEIKSLLVAVFKKGYSPSTVCLIKDVVSGVMEHAIDAEIIEHNPTFGVLKRLNLRRDHNTESADPLDWDDRKRFLDVCRQYFNEHYSFFLTMVKTGMRLGEILALKWGCVDWNKRIIRIRESYKNKRVSQVKTKSSRRDVDMSDDVFTILQDLYRIRKIEGLKSGHGQVVDIIFHRNGEYMEQNYIRRVYKRVLVKAGIRERRIHDLRHTFASLLLSAGTPQKYVQEQMGHSSIKMTCDVYGKWIRTETNAGLINAIDHQPTALLKRDLYATIPTKKAVTLEDYGQFIHMVPKGRLELPPGTPD